MKRSMLIMSFDENQDFNQDNKDSELNHDNDNHFDIVDDTDDIIDI